jgi:tetratricopeptide (TPR) repeat protein
MQTSDHERDERATKPPKRTAILAISLIASSLSFASPSQTLAQSEETSDEASPTSTTDEESQSSQEVQASRAPRLAMLSQREREEQAQNLYAAGEQAFFEREYDQAAAMWRRAFELSGHPGLVYNMGTAEMHRGDRARAISLYREFLVMAPETPAREAVEARIAEMVELLDQPPTVVRPGPFEGRFWTWIALGAAGAAGGAAAGFWAGANTRRDELAGSCGQTPNGCTGAQIADVTDRVSYTNMALSFTITATLAAAAFYFFERPEDRIVEPDPIAPPPESQPEAAADDEPPPAQEEES